MLVSVLFSACEKNVLNKRPLDVVDENTVWTDPTVAQLYVNDLYNYLSTSSNFWDNLDNMSDLTEGGHSWLACYTYNYGEVTADNDPYGKWSYYGPIRKANVLLDHSDQLTGDTALAKTVIGETLFLRAYFYFLLVRSYGGVPIIAHAQDLTDSLSVARNTYAECVQFISDQCDLAANLLPTTWDASNIGRATKGAALALKARLLLYAASDWHNPQKNSGVVAGFAHPELLGYTNGDPTARWQAAAKAAKAVIDLGVYSLYPDYANLFLDDNNQEVIFDEQWAYPYRINGDPAEIIGTEYVLNPQGLNGAFGMDRPTQEYVDMFEMANGKSITDHSSGYDREHPYVGRDPRFYASIFYNGVLWRDDTVQTYDNGKNGPGIADLYETGSSMTGYYCRKFCDPSIPCVYLVDKVKANWILFRYAEVLLNYAECQIELGHDAEARTYINKVRDRVNMPPITASGEELVKEYRDERAVELGMEEQRYFDVRRWLIAEQVLGQPVHKMHITKNSDGSFDYKVQQMERRSFPKRMYWQPVPLDEIRKNKNLVQNPGY
jgi:hypothetical protein